MHLGENITKYFCSHCGREEDNANTLDTHVNR